MNTLVAQIFAATRSRGLPCSVAQRQCGAAFTSAASAVISTSATASHFAGQGRDFYSLVKHGCTRSRVQEDA